MFMKLLNRVLRWRLNARAGFFISLRRGRLLRWLPASLGGWLVLAGCGREEAAEAALTPVVVQLDWHAEPEHGGFFQALVKGYYDEAGLDVELRLGGPNAMTLEKVALGKADISMDRSDRIIVNVSRGVPLQILGGLMQKDPQALMFHRSSGIASFEDLDGRAIMAIPGATYLAILKHRYGIDFRVIPHDYGMDRFLHDEDLVQQCFITNEPYYVEREGAEVGVLLLSESGFSPYRVWYARADYVAQNAEVVKAFNEATIRGWEDYLFGDRSEAQAMIAGLNPKMDDAFMNYGHRKMLEYALVTGEGGRPENIGMIDPERLRSQIQQLDTIGVLDGMVEVESLIDRETLVRIREEGPRHP